ncbi:hypothetical protein [Pseudophaeobacter sp.]|uniref:hypothetical protein n=1 Tax=Pseudophaeobacter sp. TaxID=1971739 RepID=UPI003296B12A
MRVRVSYQTKPCKSSGSSPFALWLIATPENAAWFAQQVSLLDGSALFHLQPGESPQSSLLRILWNIEDHHPRTEAIEVFGLTLSNSLRQILQSEGFGITTKRHGFTLKRCLSPN